MEARVLHSLRGESKQAEVARVTGMDKSTVSRLVNQHGPHFLRLLAALGHDFADPDAVQLHKDTFKALTRMASLGVEAIASKDKDAA
jgi:transcriptional regulator with XRE-family HTH domain